MSHSRRSRGAVLRAVQQLPTVRFGSILLKNSVSAGSESSRAIRRDLIAERRGATSRRLRRHLDRL